MKKSASVLVCAAFLSLGAASAWAQGARPTDPQIAAIVVTANQVDIDAGELAKSKGHAKGLLREALAREIDLAKADLFEFGGADCDGVVASVMARL